MFAFLSLEFPTVEPYMAEAWVFLGFSSNTFCWLTHGTRADHDVETGLQILLEANRIKGTVGFHL